MDYNSIIDRYYPAGSSLRDIYMRHCRSVASLALELNRRMANPLPAERVEAAAMLHDIGITRCDAPSIHCHGSLPYICHGIEGARILKAEGVDDELCRVAACHTGSGLTAAEVAAQQLPIPVADYLPVSPLERLVCFADKFYSKSGDMKRKSLAQVRRSMARHGAESLARFDVLAKEFGFDGAELAE